MTIITVILIVIGTPPLLLGLVVHYSRKSVDSLKSKKKVIGAAYDSLQLELPALAYTFLQLLRKLMLGALAVFLSGHPTFQCQLFQASALFMLVYLIHVRPFNTGLLNKMEIFNESCLLLASLHVYLFTDYCPDPGFRYRAGWSLVVLTLANLLVNLLFMLGQTLQSLWALLKILLTKLKKLRHGAAPPATFKIIPKN